MEILIVLSVLVGSAVLLVKAWQMYHTTCRANRLRAAAASTTRRQQTERWQRHRAADQKRQTAARQVQQAILQLRNSPDFRRTASFAAAARDVPLEFRQRQFRRLRPLLVNHLAEQLRTGASAEIAAAGLPELVTGLGIAEYEADYIVTEATTRTAQRPNVPTARFEDQVQRWQTEHAQRMGTLRSLTLEPELLEQLLEQEETRFREQLLTAGDPHAHADQIRI